MGSTNWCKASWGFFSYCNASECVECCYCERRVIIICGSHAMVHVFNAHDHMNATFHNVHANIAFPTNC